MVDIARRPAARSRRAPFYMLASALAVVGATAALSTLRRSTPDTPVVQRSAVWIGTVQRGPLVREVLGPGKLVPKEIRWIAAKMDARVERVLLQPGARVAADSVLLELDNSELELQALEADRQLCQSEAELTNLQATQTSQLLSQKSAIASLESELADSQRRARADQALASKGFLSELELSQTQGRASELSGRLEFEQQRLHAQARSIDAQLAAQRAQIERLRSIAEFRRREVDGLRVRAGVAGVLQELPLEQGQAVAAGALLAKVVRPDHLEAELRIPEIQAKDVQVGQAAAIDTRAGVVAGRVGRVDPAAQAGSVRVNVTLEGALPVGARPDLNVEGTIEIERLESVLFVRRPAGGQPGTRVSLFKLDVDGEGAARTRVELGRSSVKDVEIVEGLAQGDRVVLSDMSQRAEADRILLR